MRPPLVTALLVLAPLVWSAPALASPAQDAFGVSQARADAPALDGDRDGNRAHYGKGDLVTAVIDTGIDPDEPALAGKVIGFKDFVNGQTEPYDDASHGTWVSGILAGSATGSLPEGVAPGSALVGVKVVDENFQSSLQLIADGIRWVIASKNVYGIEAINLSIGDPTAWGDGTDVAERAVDDAVAAGIVVVAGTGNDGPGAGTVASPGSARDALTVGAMADPATPVDMGGPGFRVLATSSRGPTADGRTKPDIVAAGAHISAWPGQPDGAPGAGTSGATPFVTGVALLMLDADPTLTPAKIKTVMQTTAQDWGSPGADNEYGAGRLDAYAALHAAGAALATPPAVARHTSFNGTVGAASTEHHVAVANTVLPLAATLIGPADLDLTLKGPGGVTIQSATALRQEEVSVTPVVAGDYTLEVHAAAAGGAYSLDVSGGLGPLDAAAPALTLDAPLARTRDTSPVLGGRAGTALGDFPGVVARVYRAGVEIRTLPALVLPDGRWSVEARPPLADGTYQVRAEQGDHAGNVTRTALATSTIDTTPPRAVAPSPRPVTPAPDRAAPNAALMQPGLRQLGRLRGAGVRLRVRCDEACRIAAQLRIAAGTARRLGLPRRIARGSASLAGAGTAAVRLRAPSRVRARLRRVRSLSVTLKLTATDAAGNAAPVSRRLRLR